MRGKPVKVHRQLMARPRNRQSGNRHWRLWTEDYPTCARQDFSGGKFILQFRRFAANLSPCVSSATSSKNCSGIPKRVVFPEGEEPRILQAARQFYALRLGAPIVLGDTAKIKAVAEGLNIPLEGIRVINPAAERGSGEFRQPLFPVAPGKGRASARKRARRCCSRIISAR